MVADWRWRWRAMAEARRARASIVPRGVSLLSVGPPRSAAVAHRASRRPGRTRTFPQSAHEIIFVSSVRPACGDRNNQAQLRISPEDVFFSGRAVESVGPPDRALWPCGVLVGPPDRALWPCGEFGRAARPSALAFGAMVSRLDRALSPRESASGGAPLGAWLLRRARCADACPCTPSHARDRTRSDRSPVSLSRRQHSPTSLVRTVYACSAR